MLFKPYCKLAIAFLTFYPILLAGPVEQGAITELNNGAVIKLLKAGLSDDLILTTVKAAPGNYDTSADGLIALKAAGASDSVVGAIILKASSAAKSQSMPPPTEPIATDNSVPPAAQQLLPKPSTDTEPGPNGSVLSAETPRPAVASPRVYLQSASKGTNLNAARDQSMEMSKDLEKNCPGVRVTVNQQMADYVILLNHIEVGLLVRDNQVQVANRDGDLISKTKEGGSIAAGMKKACALILADWAKK